ncbi:MAG: hypothetical protein WB809_02710 [Thermoplasmata archaeon]
MARDPVVPTEGWVDRGSLGFFWSYQLVVYFVTPLLAGVLFYYEVGPDFPPFSPLLIGVFGAVVLLALGVLSERFLVPFAEPTRIRTSDAGVEMQLHRLTIWTSRFQIPWSAFVGIPNPGRPGVVILSFRNPAQHRQQIGIFSDVQYRAMLSHPARPPEWTELRIDLGG